jgi:hypothetical protein
LAKLEDFERLDIRVGVVTEVAPFTGGKYSTHILMIDFGQELGDSLAVKAELLATIRDSADTIDWPMVPKGRTLAAPTERTEALRRDQSVKEEKRRQAKEKREAAKAERERQKRMKQMLEDPQQWLRKAGQLVDARGTDNYRAAADILADLREAIGGDEGEKITRKHAAHLTKKHPTLNVLKSALRQRGLLG